MIVKLTKIAEEQLKSLINNPAMKRTLKDVVKTIELMKQNLRHPSLNTHEFKGRSGPAGEKIFEAYAQQKTSGAYRILWYYGPEKGIISIIGIIPHP